MEHTKITDEALMEHGYKKYTPTTQNASIVCVFQKRFLDASGTKYFITVNKWDHSFVPVDRRGDHYEPYGYEYELYFTYKDSGRAVKMLLYAGWTIEQAEKFAEDFFAKMQPSYYEQEE